MGLTSQLTQPIHVRVVNRTTYIVEDGTEYDTMKGALRHKAKPDITELLRHELTKAQADMVSRMILDNWDVLKGYIDELATPE